MYMNQVFSKRFWKYFIISFAIITLFSTIVIVNQYFDKFMFFSIPFSYGLRFSLIASAVILPFSLAIAVSISSFIAFRNTSLKGIPNFFKLLAIGLILFLPLSIGLYLYDWNIQPSVKKQSMEMFWSMKTYSLSPEEIKKESEKEVEFNKIPDFENSTPTVLSGAKLQFKLDSLKKEQYKQAFECRRLLALLPSEEAKEAYESYKLEQMGIEYQHAETTKISSDSLAYISQVLLYDEASYLSETIMLLGDYRIESYKRTIGGASLILSYLLFAILGYFTRSKTMTKIFGIIAVIIVASYLLNVTTNLITTYLKDILSYAK